MVWSGGSGGQSLHTPAIPYIIVIDENSLECLTQMGKIDKSQWRSQPVSWLPGNPPSSERREGLTHHNFIECVDSYQILPREGPTR